MAELIDQDTRQWDRGKLHELFEPNTVTKILAIYLTQLPQQDQVFWCLNPASEFTIKTAYNALRVFNYPPHPLLQSKDWKDLWKLKIHARLKNLLWKMAWEILPTTSVLKSRFSLSSIDCYLCNNAIESLEHIFLYCDWVAQLWFAGPWPLNMSHMNNVYIADWVKMIINPKHGLGLEGEEAKDFQLYAAILCDQIWMTSNKARLEGIKTSPEMVARQVTKTYEKHKNAWRNQSTKSPKDSSWTPPPLNWIKLNFDVAIREDKASVAVVARDQRGKLIGAWTEQLEQTKPLLGEAKATWLAIKKAADEGFKRIILEGDALNVIEPLKNKAVIPHWRIKAVLEDILFLVKYFDNVSFSFIYRDSNIIAHLLAQWAALLNWCGAISISNLSPMLVKAFDRDGHRPSLDCIDFVSSYQ